MIKNGAASRAVRDTVIIAAGSLLFAVGLDCFELPNGLAAGGVSGIATIIFALGQRVDVYIPVGLQTIAMNIVLLALVVRQRDRRYLAKTVEGILFPASLPISYSRSCRFWAKVSCCCAPSGAA